MLRDYLSSSKGYGNRFTKPMKDTLLEIATKLKVPPDITDDQSCNCFIASVLNAIFHV